MKKRTDREVTEYERSLLNGLQGLSHIYAGTASPYKVAKRRAKNRVARAQRKVNKRG